MSETGVTKRERPSVPLPERDNTKLGIWVFLGGEVIFFGSLIGILILFRVHQAADYAQFKQHLNIPLIGINTFILILSSFFVVHGLEAIQDGNRKALRNNLLLVLLLGAMFVGGQAFEWTVLFRDGVTVGSTFGTPFFTITGIHGLHVTVGLIWSLYLQWSLMRGAFSARDHKGIELFGLYWHFVDVVWIILFTLFYLI
jgi:heme/copper-type cytochrome/quinol oxidase subunit 3